MHISDEAAEAKQRLFDLAKSTISPKENLFAKLADILGITENRVNDIFNPEDKSRPSQLWTKNTLATARGKFLAYLKDKAPEEKITQAEADFKTIGKEKIEKDKPSGKGI